MLTKNINFKNFGLKYPIKKILIHLKNLLKEENEIIKSFKSNYKDSYSRTMLNRAKKYNPVIIMGMGGSILGSRAIHNFLRAKIKKKFIFKDNFDSLKIDPRNKKSRINLVISKSGNTLETISNSNVLLNKCQKNIFLTENKNSYLLGLKNLNGNNTS